MNVLQVKNDYCPVLLPDVEVIPKYVLPEKEKEHLYGFVRDMALLDLLTNQDRWNLYEEYEKNGHKQISLKELVEKRKNEKKGGEEIIVNVGGRKMRNNMNRFNVIQCGLLTYK